MQKRKSRQLKAKLRICARCKFLYRGADNECPQCGFVSYGALWAIGRECYRLEKTQERWLRLKLEAYKRELLKQIGKL